ncbi:MAG: hydantoinase/oxoprolinase family protein [Caldilineales bacterium]|nr:hydantoinase/oxoprolinase family protein [Caldilineales bacterium]
MRIATDIGGTFTDLTFLDEESGRLGVTKVPTTPANFAEGVIASLHKAQIEPGQSSFFVHGSTVVINALTERNGAKTALLTTQGFRDVLEIGRANRPDLYNLYYVKPKPFVPRNLRLEVRGRMNFRGEELEPLHEEDVQAALDLCRREGVQAVAICFLHSYANPAHEARCAELIRQLAPELAVTASSELTQEWREFERTNTAVLNSFVQPTVQRYLGSLENQLAGLGMKRVYHIMQSNGGTATFERGKQAPIYAVESGPVAGVIGAARLGELIGEPNVIAFDVGGTTAKTSLIKDGKPRITTEYKIEWRRDFAGYPILAPTIDIVEIGAGGGSIAWVDEAGSLHIGPQSAGADPGPVCYGLGGEQPTVTDANVVAGRINPDYFLGGEIRLNLERARQSMQPIADRFQCSIEEAAIGIIRLADASMINAIKLVSVRRGHDPRDFVLTAFGGGGPMHAAALARELRVKKVVIPTEPGVFSAWGMLMTDLRQDLIRTSIRRTDRMTSAELSALFSEMEGRASEDLREQGADAGAIRFQRFADMRYKGQEHTVKVPIPIGELNPTGLADIDDQFHRLHEQAYSFRLQAPIELVNYHLTAFGVVAKAEMQRADAGGSLQQAAKGSRRVYFDDFGYEQTPVYERARLPLNKPIPGPLVIEEPTSTTVVFPDQTLHRDEFGLLHIEQVTP